MFLNKYITLGVFYVLTTAKLLASDSLLIKTIPLKNIDKVTHDVYYNLYVSTLGGQVYKYDAQGNFLLQNSPQKPQQITTLDATNTIRVFCFYKDLQQFNYFDRFLTFENPIDFDTEVFGYVRASAVSSDNSIWVFDDVDLCLKKYDPIQQKVFQKTYCNQILENDSINIVYMKEYQNTLFMVDANHGIYLFDNMANFKKKIILKGALSVNFFKNTLFVHQQSQTFQIDLMDAFETKIVSVDPKAINCVYSEHYKYVVFEDKIEIWKL